MGLARAFFVALCLRLCVGSAPSKKFEEIVTISSEYSEITTQFYNLPTEARSIVTRATVFEDISENSEILETLDEKTTNSNDETTELSTTQSPCQSELKLQNHSITTHSINLTWTQEPNNAGCDFKYDLKIKRAKFEPKEIPYFRHISDGKHVFKKLESCTTYNISIRSSSGDLFERNFTTLPEELKKMTIQQKNGNSTVTWNKPRQSECNKYQVKIEGKSIITKQNYFELGTTRELKCTKIQIAAVDEKNNIGNSVTRKVPGVILNLRPDFTTHTMTLTWDPPEDNSCVTSYSIKFDGIPYNTEETSYEFKDLEGCTTYQGEVSAVSDTGDKGASESFTGKTPKPTELKEPVSNLQLVPSLEDIKATWSPPNRLGNCIYRYKIQVWDQNGDTNDYDTPDAYYTIDPIIPCMVYNFQITPTLSEAIYGILRQENVTADAQPTTEPDVQNIVWTKSSVSSTVTIQGYKENMCLIESIVIKCEYDGDKESLEPWMIEKNSISYDYSSSGSSRPPVEIVLEDLSPFTPYKCKAKVINLGGESTAHKFSGRTEEDVPDPPENLEWTESTKMLSWEKPNKIPGIQGNYIVDIEYKNLNHFIPNSDECKINIDNIEGNETDGHEFLYDKTLPNANYFASVKATTGVGEGEAATKEFTTHTIASESVRNINVNFTNILGDEYDVTAHIYFMVPCNSNGKMTVFRYKITENGSEFDEKEIPVVGETIDYNFDIENIKANANYSVTIFVITLSTENSELIGEENTTEFTSPEGYPSAPQNIKIIDIKANSAKIEWDEPINTNGIISEYEIIIDPIKPIHEVPEGCEINLTTINDTVDGDTFMYEYTEFEPNYEYKVTIKASTSAGYGREEVGHFQTETTKSEQIRNPSIYTTPPDVDNYDSKIIIKFSPPCNLNGVFHSFRFVLEGKRIGFGDHKIDVTEPNYENTAFEDYLKPEYEYEGFITVKTEPDLESEECAIETFTSHAGVPSNIVQDLDDVEVIDAFKAVFTLNPETFSQENGYITYYAIILAPGNFESEKNFGIIENGLWPEIGKWTESGELKEYQTTPIEWNPFHTKDTNAIAFTIGTDENCKDLPTDEFCNGPLRPDTEYSLRLRGFTSFGFRDSKKITFWTPTDINYAALIGGIVGGALGLLIIFIIIIVLWRRKRSRKTVEDTAMDTLSIVPKPIPADKFCDHYEDYKLNLNKLKGEYSYLERRGVEEQLPMTFAMTDDNKKKNRYINVLPFDDTRVKLGRDKNDNYTDYINASYIKGYSGNIEYIATQGPLESTVVDFWRMIIQENVSVIIMVAQFVEQNKTKCHQYFPGNHETMTIDDGIEIRCSNQVPLGPYIKRTLMVQRESMQMTITHLQYIEWPDFGCPNNTESMLDFCSTVRQCIEQYKSKTVIHCSAGVGRTGTLIALDILLQTIENKGDIDIFKTVLNLRKQRVRMVQTEKQYIFIHSCLAEYLSNPRKEKNLKAKEAEPIYENIVIKRPECNGDETNTDVP